MEVVERSVHVKVLKLNDGTMVQLHEIAQAMQALEQSTPPRIALIESTRAGCILEKLGVLRIEVKVAELRVRAVRGPAFESFRDEFWAAVSRWAATLTPAEQALVPQPG